MVRPIALISKLTDSLFSLILLILPWFRFGLHCILLFSYLLESDTQVHV